MTITTFKNMKGLIHGKNPKRIRCKQEGTLKIGQTDVKVTSENTILPILIHGATGQYDATFTTSSGDVYQLEKVDIREGRIVPPPAVAVELMDLRCRADEAERKCEELQKEVERLDKIFDTNALNFLIG